MHELQKISFQYDNLEKRWKLSPAYDITYSSTAWNEQSTTVNGKGKNISIQDLVQLGIQNGLDDKKAHQRALEIKQIVEKKLTKYLCQ